MKLYIRRFSGLVVFGSEEEPGDVTLSQVQAQLSDYGTSIGSWSGDVEEISPAKFKDTVRQMCGEVADFEELLREVR